MFLVRLPNLHSVNYFNQFIIMKIPTNSNDLKNELFTSIDLFDKIGDLRIRQLMKLLPKISDDIIIEGIVQVFENENRPETLYIDQKYAGKILLNFNPKTNQDIEVVLLRVLKNWNKSVEEFPFWLEKNYGTQKLQQVFLKLKNSHLTEIELDKMGTMRRFLQL